MIENAFRLEIASWERDLPDLRAVRETVFVVEQQVPVEEEWDALDPASVHVIARDDHGRPIGTGRLTPERKIGRMAVLREWRGRGVGDAMLRTLLEQARARHWPGVSLNAQLAAIPFYQRAGFDIEGEEFIEAGIRHRAIGRGCNQQVAQVIIFQQSEAFFLDRRQPLLFLVLVRLHRRNLQ